MLAVVPRALRAARKAVYRIQWRVRIGFAPISPAVHGKQTSTATSRRQRFSCRAQYRRPAKRPSSARERERTQRQRRIGRFTEHGKAIPFALTSHLFHGIL